LLATHAVRLTDSYGDSLLLFLPSRRHTPSSVCYLQSTHNFLFTWRHTPTDPTHGPIPTHGELSVVAAWRHTQQAFLTHREILFTSLSTSIPPTILLVICRSYQQSCCCWLIYRRGLHLLLSFVNALLYQRCRCLLLHLSILSTFFLSSQRQCASRRASELKPSSIQSTILLVIYRSYRQFVSYLPFCVVPATLGLASFQAQAIQAQAIFFVFSSARSRHSSSVITRSDTRILLSSYGMTHVPLRFHRHRHADPFFKPFGMEPCRLLLSSLSPTLGLLSKL